MMDGGTGKGGERRIENSESGRELKKDRDTRRPNPSLIPRTGAGIRTRENGGSGKTG